MSLNKSCRKCRTFIHSFEDKENKLKQILEMVEYVLVYRTCDIIFNLALYIIKAFVN